MQPSQFKDPESNPPVEEAPELPSQFTKISVNHKIKVS
jgi:hypothetical protein